MPTYGGYSEKIVASEKFVLRIPDGLDHAGAAPLLCAGITTWSPLRHWKVPPGVKHWDGAGPSTAMAHAAIAEALDGKPVTWLEKVSDEQYRKQP